MRVKLISNILLVCILIFQFEFRSGNVIRENLESINLNEKAENQPEIQAETKQEQIAEPVAEQIQVKDIEEKVTENKPELQASETLINPEVTQVQETADLTTQKKEQLEIQPNQEATEEIKSDQQESEEVIFDANEETLKKLLDEMHELEKLNEQLNQEQSSIQPELNINIETPAETDYSKDIQDLITSDQAPLSNKKKEGSFVKLSSKFKNPKQELIDEEDSASENEMEATFYLGDIYNFEDEELDDIQDLEEEIDEVLAEGNNLAVSKTENSKITTGNQLAQTQTQQSQANLNSNKQLSSYPQTFETFEKITNQDEDDDEPAPQEQIRPTRYKGNITPEEETQTTNTAIKEAKSSNFDKTVLLSKDLSNQKTDKDSSDDDDLYEDDASVELSGDDYDDDSDDDSSSDSKKVSTSTAKPVPKFQDLMKSQVGTSKGSSMIKFGDKNFLKPGEKVEKLNIKADGKASLLDGDLKSIIFKTQQDSNQIQGKLGDAQKKITQKLNEALLSIASESTSAENNLETVYKAKMDKIDQIFQRILKDMKIKFSQDESAIDEKFSTILQSISDVLKGAENSIETQYHQTVDGIIQQASTTDKELFKKFKHAESQIDERLRHAEKELEKKAKSIVNELSSSFVSVKGELNRYIGSEKSSIEATIKDGVDRLTKLIDSINTKSNDNDASNDDNYKKKDKASDYQEYSDQDQDDNDYAKEIPSTTTRKYDVPRYPQKPSLSRKPYLDKKEQNNFDDSKLKNYYTSYKKNPK